MKDPAPIASAAEALPRWKRRIFLLVTLLVPVAVLAAAELALRACGWGGYPPFVAVAGELAPGQSLCYVEPAASKPYFFANPTRPGYADQSHFLMPKPAGTVRIVLFGESAAKGYPQPPNLSMAAFLREMLADAWPGRSVEVIDFGTTAVASFPIVSMAKEMERYQPDLFVFYVGNNEFFGAYGTASINSAGTLPTWALPWMRAVRGLALVQAVDFLFRPAADTDRTLMEQMIGQAVIVPDSPLRAAAASNLGTHVRHMVSSALAAGIPSIVCTTASNECGLSPLGDPDGAAAARFADGARLAAAGDRAGARQAFLDARDLDTMPWRPVRATEEAVRAAARDCGAPLCDIAERFREMSPQGAAGWDLLDDHVHLSVRGQAEAARCMVRTMSELPGAVRVDPAAESALPAWDSYARRLGTNPFDDYRVNHTMRVLFGVSFMKRSNPAAFARFEDACRRAEAAMSPSVLQVAREWQSSLPHAGALRPITGMVARVHLRENRPAEAAVLYDVARRQVPKYTSWHLEYVYSLLACRERTNGSLTDADRALAADGIAEGSFLLMHGHSGTGLTERHVGRLHQLRGEFAESIPFLLAARPKLGNEDLVACDQALFLAYLRTGRADDAAALADRGAREAGRFAPVYARMREELARTRR